MLVFHLYFHYFFFERAALSPDNYASLINYKINHIDFNLLDYFKKYHDRPINFFVIDLLHSLFDDNTKIYFILLIISSFSILVSVFIFFNLITKDKNLSLLLVIIYDLLPNKLEIFHSSIFININFSLSVYIFTAIFYLLFYLKNNYIYLFLSYIFFFISSFWYEVGFFTPVAFFFCVFFFDSFSYKRIKIFLLTTPFIFLMIFYITFRLTGSFGHASLTDSLMGEKVAQLTSIPNAFYDIFQNYLGRYNIRSIIYGIYVFFHIKFYYLFFLFIFNIIFILFFNKFLKKIHIIHFSFNKILFLLFFCFLSLLPNLLYGSFGGRHTVLASISLVLIIFYLINFLNLKYRNFLINLFVFFTIFVSQGNAWTHVVSLRMTNSIFETLQENNEKIISLNSILIDVESFKKNIKYSFFDKDYNNFNTYYGAQLLENWGITSMIGLSTNNKPLEIFIASSELLIDNNLLSFYRNKSVGYNKVLKEKISIPSTDIFIVDYDLVYANGFFNGNRI